MNRKLSALLFTGVFVIVSVAILQGHTFADPVADPKVKGVDELRLERRDCLAAASKALLAEFGGGHAPIYPVLSVSKQLLEAELEIAKKKEARMKAYATYLKTTTELERQALVSLNRGTGTRQEAFFAKAQRLEAEFLIVGLDKK